MGSTGAGNEGIEFSISPEQRARDKVDDERAEIFAKLKGEQPDLASQFAELAGIKNKGGFDIGDSSNLPPLSAVTPNLGESIHAQQAFTGSPAPVRSLELDPQHLSLRPESPSHQQDTGFKEIDRGILRHDPIATAEHRIGQQGGFNLNMDDEGITPSRKGGFSNAAAPIDDTVEGRLFAERGAGTNATGQPLQRIGTELGVEAEAATGAVGGAGTAAGGAAATAAGGFAATMGAIGGAIFLAEQASSLAHKAISGEAIGLGVADEMFNPGKARIGSFTDVLRAAQTDNIERLGTNTGRYQDFIRHQTPMFIQRIFSPTMDHG